MGDYLSRYNDWLNADLGDPALRRELFSIAGNNDEIYERFYENIKFGTAGLRGILGVGTSRMNIITVGRAVAGLAASLKADNLGDRGVAIAYDSRICSRQFALHAASVLTAAGVRVYLFSELAATPLLSYAVRQLSCAAGIVITASHNPAEYNGLKVYGPDGGQLDTKESGRLYSLIEKNDPFTLPIMPPEAARAAGLLLPVPEYITDSYLSSIKDLLTDPELLKTSALRVVYTPLYGTGIYPMERLLGELGLENLYVVPEQREPDGRFPTAPYPNPEDPAALKLALKLAAEQSADIVVATDPDADRLSIAVRDNSGGLVQLSGNEMGCLLLDYMAAGLKAAGRLPERGIAIRSVVSSPMFDIIAAHYGISPIAVLTGFKNVAAQLRELDKAGESERFVMAYEESNGFMPGSFVRDKDGIAAALLFIEMAAADKASGRTLLCRLSELYDRFGHYATRGRTFSFPGAEGMGKMADIMKKLRQNPPAAIGDLSVTQVDDYITGFSAPYLLGGDRLPPSDMLILRLSDGSTAIVRPSGTEPKLKLYLMCKSGTTAAAAEKTAALAGSFGKIIDPV